MLLNQRTFAPCFVFGLLSSFAIAILFNIRLPIVFTEDTNWSIFFKCIFVGIVMLPPLTTPVILVISKISKVQKFISFQMGLGGLTGIITTGGLIANQPLSRDFIMKSEINWLITIIVLVLFVYLIKVFKKIKFRIN